MMRSAVIQCLFISNLALFELGTCTSNFSICQSTACNVAVKMMGDLLPCKAVNSDMRTT